MPVPFSLATRFRLEPLRGRHRAARRATEAGTSDDRRATGRAFAHGVTRAPSSDNSAAPRGRGLPQHGADRLQHRVDRRRSCSATPAFLLRQDRIIDPPADHDVARHPLQTRVAVMPKPAMLDARLELARRRRERLARFCRGSPRGNPSLARFDTISCIEPNWSNTMSPHVELPAPGADVGLDARIVDHRALGQLEDPGLQPRPIRRHRARALGHDVRAADSTARTRRASPRARNTSATAARSSICARSPPIQHGCARELLERSVSSAHASHARHRQPGRRALQPLRADLHAELALEARASAARRRNTAAPTRASGVDPDHRVGLLPDARIAPVVAVVERVNHAEQDDRPRTPAEHLRQRRAQRVADREQVVAGRRRAEQQRIRARALRALEHVVQLERLRVRLRRARCSSGSARPASRPSR